ncbi:hypothetical protein ACEWY4_008019 [Coilia grayii]|uniref:CD80-like immunoglobulin C2-set domain-containing protein n=1 Tax=Coilia grayii TaxID=363190 RepID=A0ABD1K9W9_9TELE
MATTILICLLALSVGSGHKICEGAVQGPRKVIQADVGGRVVLDSEGLSDKDVHLYWQRGPNTATQDIFVNGLSKTRNLSVGEEFRNRSRVNETTGNLELWDLKLSDTAYYVLIRYEMGSGQLRRLQSSLYHLNVTASFRKPTLTAQLRDDGLVEVTCATSGGFPRRDIQWLVSGGLSSTDWEVINRSECQEPLSQLWDVKSTVVMNCTQLLNVSCEVGSATSEYLEICRQSSPFPFEVIIAIGVLGALALSMVVGCCVKIFKSARPSRRQPDGELERSGTESLRTTPEPPGPEEETSLSLLTPPR